MIDLRITNLNELRKCLQFVIRNSKKFVFRRCITTFSFFIITFFTFGWGFWAHKKINRMACFTVPSPLFVFYKNHIEFITEHAIDPDRRRYADPDEAPRHFIDLDHYIADGLDSIPKYWN